MSEAVSALNGASYDGTVTVQELGLQGMITLRGDLKSATLKESVKAATGCAMPKAQEIKMSSKGSVAWMSPDELLLMVPYAEVEPRLTALNKAMKGEHFLAVNVSDARGAFEITGNGVREVIAKLCPVDMAAGAFDKGRFRRTRMAQAAAAIWMIKEETIRIVCFRSVAHYVFGLLVDAAEPGGEVGFFD